MIGRGAWQWQKASGVACGIGATVNASAVPGLLYSTCREDGTIATMLYSTHACQPRLRTTGRGGAALQRMQESAGACACCRASSSDSLAGCHCRWLAGAGAGDGFHALEFAFIISFPSCSTSTAARVRADVPAAQAMLSSQPEDGQSRDMAAGQSMLAWPGSALLRTCAIQPASSISPQQPALPEQSSGLMMHSISTVLSVTSAARLNAASHSSSVPTCRHAAGGRLPNWQGGREADRQAASLPFGRQAGRQAGRQTEVQRAFQPGRQPFSQAAAAP